MRRPLLRVAVLTLIVLMQSPPALLAQGGQKNRIDPPDVPPILAVPPGHSPFFHGLAVGTQNWICTLRGSSFSWGLLGGQATLFQQSRTGLQQVATHFRSPNPYFYDASTPSWQHSQDTSLVWAYPFHSSSDPLYVEPGAMDWRVFESYGTKAGPTGGSLFTRTTYIHRVRTSGGLRPSAPCSTQDNGRIIMVPYSAEYYFYEATSGK